MSRPIRVLIVDTAIAFGGSLVVARNLLKHLDPTVIDASLVSACKDGFVSEGFAGDAKIKLLAPHVDYIRLQKWKQAIQRYIRWAALRRILALGAMCLEFVGNFPYFLRLLHLYHKMDVEVVHANNYTMEPLWAARLLGIPVVYHLHGFLPENLDGSGRRNFRHVSTFVAISTAVKVSAVRAGIDPTRILEIPNFVERLPEPPFPFYAPPTIGIFGRITHWKGQKEFLRAALRLLPRFPGLRVLLVGGVSDGNPKYLRDCEQIALTSPFAGQIEFTGVVNDVSTFYKQCTVVVHASIEPEPFGMVLIEAMAEGRPVVASIFGAAPEVVEDGVTGYLVDPNDAKALSERIADLLSNPQLAATMGTEGHQKVRQKYNPQDAARQFESVYAQIISSARTAT